MVSMTTLNFYVWSDGEPWNGDLAGSLVHVQDQEVRDTPLDFKWLSSPSPSLPSSWPSSSMYLLWPDAWEATEGITETKLAVVRAIFISLTRLIVIVILTRLNIGLIVIIIIILKLNSLQDSTSLSSSLSSSFSQTTSLSFVQSNQPSVGIRYHCHHQQQYPYIYRVFFLTGTPLKS